MCFAGYWKCSDIQLLLKVNYVGVLCFDYNHADFDHI